MTSFSKPISRISPSLVDESSPLRRLGNVHWGPLVAALSDGVVVGFGQLAPDVE